MKATVCEYAMCTCVFCMHNMTDTIYGAYINTPIQLNNWKKKEKKQKEKEEEDEKYQEAKESTK